MVRPAFVLALIVLAAGVASAGSSARVMGMYVQRPQAQPAPLPMVDSDIEVAIRGPIVETIVTQRFHNRSDRATEATYIFPLPPDAAVTAMSIKTGTRTIRAAIEKREEAQRRYEDAVRAGVAASVLDQERPDVFTQTVAAIPAKSTVEVTLRYDTLARYADGTWSLTLPMVVAPRYVPGTASGRPTTGTGRSPDTDRAPDASRVTPHAAPQGGGSTTITLAFAEPVTDVSSPTHDVSGKGVGFTLTDPHSDHDAVIRWRSARNATGWVEAAGDGGFAAVVVEAPPAPARSGTARLVLVLDHAATMKGDAMLVVQPFVRALAGALGNGDRVTIAGSYQVAASAPADALRALEQAWVSAGAPFDLTRVLASVKPNGAPLVIVTDGLVADDRGAIAAAKRLGVPVHVIGVGPAPARGLLTQLAAQTGGTLRFALPTDDLTALARATAADVTTAPAPLTVTWGTLAASEVTPSVLPRLGAGQAMLVLARVKRVQTANARAAGELFALQPTSPARVDGSVTPLGPLARRWARTKLDDLLVGPPNPAAVTKHALTYGLVSPYTSLVAIGDEVVVEGGTKHSVAVPVSVPAGMRWQDVKRETTVEVEAPREEQVATKKKNTPARPVVTKAPPRTPADKTTADAKEGKPTRPTADQAIAPAAPEPAPITSTTSPMPVPRQQQSADLAEPPSDAAGGESLGADDADEEDSYARVATASPAGADYELTTESISVATGTSGRFVRLSASLGGGLTLADDTSRALLSLGARIEAGRRNLVGIDTALWLVHDVDTQGRLLVSFARRGIARWLELGAGLGIHLGGGVTGPAASLSLRLHLPPAPRGSIFSRYDVALEGQHTLTFGLEWGF